MKVCQYGVYDFIPDGLIPEARVALTLNPAELTAHWRRCSLISDFAAGYIASAFSPASKMRQSDIFNSVSTITQELIENAAKFSLQRDSVVDVELLHFDRLFAFSIKNTASSAVALEFEQHIQTLLTAQDLDSMYVDILEKRRDNESRSGIGLLLLMKDHGLKLGVRFSEDTVGKTTISVRAIYFLGDE